jgi:hypothetical protein
MPEGDTLRMRADRQLAEFGKQLEEFNLLESTTRHLGGEPAIYMRFAWLSAAGPLEQSVTLVSRHEEVGRFLTTFTTSTPRDVAAASRDVFREFLASVTFDPPARSERPPRPSQILPSADLPLPASPMPGTSGRHR